MKFSRFSQITLAVLFMLLTISAEAGLFDRKKKESDPNKLQQQLLELLPEAALEAEYSGKRTMTFSGQQIESKIFHSKMNERNEMSMSGMDMVTITRMDKGVIYQLMPSMNQYMEIEMADVAGGTDGEMADGITLEKKARVSVNGVMTTHYHMPEFEDDGTKMEMDYFISDAGVPMRMIMKGSNGKRKRDQFEMQMDLTDVEVAPQADYLFEVPENYTAMSMGMPGGFMGELGDEMKDGAEAGAKDTARNETRRKVGKMLKDLID